MARYIAAVCRICRREGEKLFLKGERCYTPKCAVERKGYPPGMHGQGRGKISAYGEQLREKQKVRRMYGLLEEQFKGTFLKADRQKGITGENLLRLLERRLDNVVFRLGFASSRTEARMLVRHGHFLVGGRKVNIPSYSVKPGELIEVREKSRGLARIREALDGVARRGVPPWLELDKGSFRGQVRGMPTREDISFPIREHLIVELYSK